MNNKFKEIFSNKSGMSTQTLIVIIIAILVIVIFGGYVYNQLEFFRSLFQG